MVEGSKQVRVDNWGIFFLQRLQMFFSKTDYCDLTLQFEGNVQLKVHRLVMNACTEYFTFLEQSCPALEENTIMMPSDLQADVIVPIVNFMYTGMLEFHLSIFEKLYKAAELMNITVLTKLLDAQKIPLQAFKQPKKKTETPYTWNLQGKKISAKTTNTPELPPVLPGRKLPVWKRKNVPSVPMQHPSSQLHFSDQTWTKDPLSLPDNTPKPTRFEWPDEDLPPVNLMETSFDEISYTSKPLLTQQEENRASTSFDEVKNNVNGHPKKSTSKTAGGDINIKEIEEHVREQRIRSDLATLEEGEDDYGDYGQKRKLDQNVAKSSPKRIKVNDKENKETTISIRSNNTADLDHTKIVSEILKKYPQLVKKNKNIRLKIMASGNGGNKPSQEERIHTSVKVAKVKEPEEQPIINKPVKIIKPVLEKPKPKEKLKGKFNEEGPWNCQKCIEAGEPIQEFVLYYLFRKHMTDAHNEVFDLRLCKYCGRKCGKHNLMMHHLYTKHGLKPPTSYNFPKCDQCPYIALSAEKLTQHKLRHDPNEMQCVDCKLAFTSQQTLTAHIQITGHFNKTGRSNYDCQYCTKKLQSAINLLTHIKNSHMKEAKRDGIVSLDELDESEENEHTAEEKQEEEKEREDEYVVPEILPDSALQRDKVKIISNVKVPHAEQGGAAQQQVIPLEPSSEAEALSNVASGIATSLGLVDIVVLDENQQYILQQQENQSGQTEFILPELTSNENPFSGQVITTQHSNVLPQGMLQSTGGDIASTDELVMVLTDHDYQDEQEGTTADNSNIVVLYSHPVDGQQGQFITSQGNLLVNSQTGMLEIRNGATIATTTASSMVVNSGADTPIESIEMIQREIEGHSEMKQEPFYEEEGKSAATKIHGEPAQVPIEENVQEHSEVETEEISINTEKTDDSTAQNESLEESIESSEGNPEEHSTIENQVEKQEKSSESRVENEDNVDGSSNTIDEPMEVEELPQAPFEDTSTKELLVRSEPAENIPAQEEEQNTQNPVEETSASEEDKGVDIPPDAARVPHTIPLYEQSETLVINDPSNLYMHGDGTPEKKENASGVQSDVEPMEVDGRVEEQPQRDQCLEDKEVENKEDQIEDQDPGQIREVEEVSVPEKGNETITAEHSEPEQELQDPLQVSPLELHEEHQDPHQVHQEPLPEHQEPHREHHEPQEDNSQLSEFQHQSENSDSQYNEDDDENSQSSQGTSQSQENGSNRSQSNINQTILDDWDDTDSQQSEKQRVAMKEAAENVNKLMDDWEEEDEEDRREGD